jgi:lysozyme
LGYGHLIKEGEPYRNTPITEITAEKLLIQDAAFAENAVTKLVTHGINPNQFAALVSLTYNIGEGNFKQSTLLKRLNNAELNAVPGEILKWHFAGCKPISGLIRRRAAEAQLFLS